jgi:beta-aspartyl-peptidase (threonine type)
MVATLALILAGGVTSGQTSQPAEPKFGIVMHGGAGAIAKADMTPEKEAAYREKMTEAILAGHKILSDGGSSLDAVEAAVKILEDSPLFNAGKGAVFTSEGVNELDASIMDGRTLKAGAVAAVRRIRNPVSLARLVMDKSANVLLVGEGAEAFAVKQGVELVDPSYFFTPQRWEQLQKAKERQKNLEGEPKPPASSDQKHGTVGAVALDKHGNLAAATSTGGLTNKAFGRVGDSPIVGAGVYADNDTCAVSATGHGEYFIRLVVSYDISALMAYRQMGLEQAARTVIMEKLTKLGGTGGVVAIDKDANVAMPFNTPGMYRGYAIGPDPKVVFKIYRD